MMRSIDDPWPRKIRQIPARRAARTPEVNGVKSLAMIALETDPCRVATLALFRPKGSVQRRTGLRILGGDMIRWGTSMSTRDRCRPTSLMPRIGWLPHARATDRLRARIRLGLVEHSTAMMPTGDELRNKRRVGL